MSRFWPISFLTLFCVMSLAAPEGQEVDQKTIAYRTLCKQNELYSEKALPFNERVSIDCNYNYHHYHSDASRKYYKRGLKAVGGVKIASFNLWHPGKSNSRFKDLTLVATILNRYDVIAAQELLPTVGDEANDNERIVAEMQKISENKSLNSSMDELVKIYNVPGYFKILLELRKLDPSWALVLSSRGEAQKDGDVEELVGFYYRATKVRPKVNEYCREMVTLNKGNPVACTPHFSKFDMGYDYKNLFSRRPFMGSFLSGKFDFTLISAHVIFTSPGTGELKKEILKKVFNANSIDDIGSGATVETYARLAEVKMTLDFVSMIKNKYREKDVIYTGDFNLESNNEALQRIVSTYENVQLLNSDLSSVSDIRFDSKGEATHGHASNYDHFILDEKETNECDFTSVKAMDFMTDAVVDEYLREHYLIRSENLLEGYIYSQNPRSSEIVRKQFSKLKAELLGKKRIVRSKIVETHDQKSIHNEMKDFAARVFNSQFSDDSYYRVYRELISDHLPIEINCRN